METELVEVVKGIAEINVRLTGIDARLRKLEDHGIIIEAHGRTLAYLKGWVACLAVVGSLIGVWRFIISS